MSEEKHITIFCTPAKDYDYDLERKTFSNPENWSSTREGAVCKECGQPVVMSQKMYEEVYLENDPRPDIVCASCLMKYLAEQNE